MKEKRQVIMIGTRGSPLALVQANTVARALRKDNKQLVVQIKTISTAGDQDGKKIRGLRDSSGKDTFTKAIDIALKNREIDLAVHSMKDVPVEEFRGALEIVAYPKRAPPFDVLISKNGKNTLASLPEGAKIGTSSLRRAIQLKQFRSDLEIVELHGNVDTRISRLQNGSSLDAVVLARAGLQRLGHRKLGRDLPTRVMLPAVGQGSLAVVARKGDRRTKAFVAMIDDRDTRAAVTAERAFSRELGGGCNLPIAAYGKVLSGKLELEGLAQLASSAASSSQIVVRSKITGTPAAATKLGRSLALRLKRLVREK